MPPRHTKSEFASVYFPAWMMGRNPKLKIIQATHTTELATGLVVNVKLLLTVLLSKNVFPMLVYHQKVKRLVVGIRSMVVNISPPASAQR